MDDRSHGAFSQRLTAIVSRLSARRETSGFWIIVAVAGFLIGGALSVRSLDLQNARIQIWPLVVVAFAGVPAAALLTAREYHLSTRSAGLEVSFVDALRTSITATAANLLPLPGGAIVRVAELTRSGSSPLMAAGITAAMGMIWIGTAGFAAAIALLFVNNPVAAGLFALGGAGFLALGWPAFRGGRGGSALFRATVLVELASVAVDAARLWLVFRGIGITLSPAEPTVISLSNVLASAVGIFPGGLGLREALAAALAPLVSVDSGLAFMTTAINRFVAIIVQAPLLLGLVARRRT